MKELTFLLSISLLIGVQPKPQLSLLRGLTLLTKPEASDKSVGRTNSGGLLGNGDSSLLGKAAEVSRSLLIGDGEASGLTDLIDPIIQLKRVAENGSVSTEPDCIRTFFMSPYAKPVKFSANGSIGSRTDKSCKWNFIGTEPCIPMLSCSEFNLLEEGGKCKEYLEISDGNVGKQKFCGNKGPSSVSAHDGLRDLFVNYVASESAERNEPKFTCTVSCSNRGDGTPLAAGFLPEMNSLCQCGKRPNQDRIVNGEDAKKQEFPWMVALVVAQTRQPFCGASIINDRIVLTAAHCFKGSFLDVSNVEVLVGGHKLDVTPSTSSLSPGEKISPKRYSPAELKELDAGNGTVRFIVEEVIMHPLYVVETNDFDVAVLRLAHPIDFHKFTQLGPVCLPELGSYLRTFSSYKAIVAGWGLDGAESAGTQSVLQKLNVTVYNPVDCKNTYAHRVNRRMLCAGFREGGRDSCSGDSGGPLILEDKPQVWYQVGTVSWGDGCAESNSPGAYIRMTEVGQWIHHHSNINGAIWCAVPSRKNK